jgi:hypothetical protein
MVNLIKKYNYKKYFVLCTSHIHVTITDWMRVTNACFLLDYDMGRGGGGVITTHRPLFRGLLVTGKSASWRTPAQIAAFVIL